MTKSGASVGEQFFDEMFSDLSLACSAQLARKVD